MTLFSLITTAGSPWLLTYPFTIISAAALLAEYGFDGSRVLDSAMSAASASPYTWGVVQHVFYALGGRSLQVGRPHLWRCGRIAGYHHTP